MKYIVEGPALAKLLQENRIRINRGDLKFTPVGGEGYEAEKASPVEDSKEVKPEADAKKPVKKAKK